ncbi:hypothetical protein, partial [Pseudomonas sp. DrBHI1]|uniref:hypothetical protein n=1 Tax=Pseudomonas sp. DrBHI1 TaxID=2006091 RepID=UPI000B625317
TQDWGMGQGFQGVADSLAALMRSSAVRAALDLISAENSPAYTSQRVPDDYQRFLTHTAEKSDAHCPA